MYEEIIKRHRPKGWRVVFSRRRNKVADIVRADLQEKQPQEDILLTLAITYWETKTIKAPYVVDEFTLAILLHEFGHVKLDHYGKGEGPLHREEFEAEKWAMNTMQTEGVPVPAYIRKGAKRYVRHCIERDEKKGVEIQSHVKRFAKKAENS